MKLYWVTAPVGLIIAGFGLALYDARPISTNLPPGQPRHPVTERMLREAAKRKLAPAYLPVLEDSAGMSQDLRAVNRTKPLVLIAIKDGCPCSIDAQPLFNSLASRYAGKAQFFGFISSPRVVASNYHSDMNVRFPVLPDPKLQLANAYKSKQSIYVTLVAPGGTILKVWPGYSQAMLREMDAALAEMTESRLPPLDVSEAPKTPTAGCPLKP